MHVETRSLTKRYGSFTALDCCTLGIPRGEIFGLLGPNGAGKTTLLRLLLGFIRPTDGIARVDGLDVVACSERIRRRIAYLPGEARLYRRMNGRQVLDFFARLRTECDQRRVCLVAERLDLDLGRQVARMSTGMRQKLALSVVLATDCDLLILDEPTANLDPTARAEVLDLVLEARRAGQTVIFSSHVLSEIEATCDRVAILRSGAVVHEQTMASLRRRHRIRARLVGELVSPPASLAGRIEVRGDAAGRVELEVAESLSAMLGWLATLPLEEIEIEPVGLAVVYDQFHREERPGRSPPPWLAITTT